MDNFLAGFAFGVTNVVVGQPLDTIKTRIQVSLTHSPSSLKTGLTIFRQEGIWGLYRGGIPLLIGGGLIRSAQFGVYEYVLRELRSLRDPSIPISKFFGVFDPDIIVSGFLGGVGRGIVEGPFEYIKVRQQVVSKWYLSEMLKGMGATIFRNSGLFGSFMIYIDLSKQIFPGGLGPFLTGSVCSSMAWLTIWPLDVAKTQLQSGNYKGRSFTYLVSDVVHSGALFRGLVPGITRSFFSNGLAMIAYQKTLAFLKTTSS